MSAEFCRQCQKYKTLITIHQGRVYAMAKKLNKPDAKNPEKLLAQVNEAKEALALYEEMSKEHQIEHALAEL